MIFEYTEQEKQQLIAIDKAIAAKLDKLDKIILSSSKDSAEYQEATREATRLADERQQAFAELYEQAELKHFKAISGSTDSIIQNAKEQTEAIINNLYQTMLDLYGRLKGDEKSPSGSLVIPIQNIIENEKTSLRADVEKGGIILNAAQTLAMIRSGLHLHFKALKNDKEALAVINDYIITTVTNSPYIAKYDATAPIKEDIQDLGFTELLKMSGPSEATVNTIYPVNFLTPTDKVSNLAFSNELTGGQIQQLAMERRGRKKITTLASINFDNLNGSVQIKGRKELTAYDREVHDAIITLYVDGGNEYITPQMIYQVMTGNPKATLKAKQAEAISNSITKCMYSRLIIDASEEAKAYGFDSFKYDGSLISGERVTATLNGTVVECLRILRTPVLYEYANKKNQIGRFAIKLLNTPINKNEEIITLQGYLYRRILSMKNNPNLSKTILYETVYNQLNIQAASDGALRKKKSKVRDQIKTILDYWKQEDFIAGYVENRRGQVVYSVTIRL
jgi:hypothetical protein